MDMSHCTSYGLGLGYNRELLYTFWFILLHVLLFCFFYRLAVIYTGAMADIKRTILRTLETPVS